VGEADGYEDLIPAVGRDHRRAPLAVGGRTRAQIHGDIQDGTAHYTHQLVLCEGWDLKVQAPHGAGLGREGVVVLHEVEVYAGRRQCLAAVGLGEEAPSIAVLTRVQKPYGRDGERFNKTVHALQNHPF
jgi:hypothetical protein